VLLWSLLIHDKVRCNYL